MWKIKCHSITSQKTRHQENLQMQLVYKNEDKVKIKTITKKQIEYQNNNTKRTVECKGNIENKNV